MLQISLLKGKSATFYRSAFQLIFLKAASASSEDTRISRGLLPRLGPMIFISSIVSIRLAARV